MTRRLIAKFFCCSHLVAQSPTRRPPSPNFLLCLPSSRPPAALSFRFLSLFVSHHDSLVSQLCPLFLDCLISFFSFAAVLSFSLLSLLVSHLDFMRSCRCCLPALSPFWSPTSIAWSTNFLLLPPCLPAFLHRTSSQWFPYTLSGAYAGVISISTKRPVLWVGSGLSEIVSRVLV